MVSNLYINSKISIKNQFKRKIKTKLIFKRIYKLYIILINMGIFRYFRYITKQYPSCYSTIKRCFKLPSNTLSNPFTEGVECVLFDLNAIIHPCFQKVFEYGMDKSKTFLKNEKMIEIQKKKDSMTYEELERWAFNMVTKKLKNLFIIPNLQK